MPYVVFCDLFSHLINTMNTSMALKSDLEDKL